MLEIILSVGYAAFFLFLIGKMPLFQAEKVGVKTFQGLFLLKLAAAFVLYLIYTRFYPDRQNADILRYYEDSKYMYDSAFQKPWDFFRMFTGYNSGANDLFQYYDKMHNWFNSRMVFNDSRTMIRLAALMRFVSFGTYFPIAVMMSFLGLMGLTGIYKIFISALPGRETWMLIIVFLMPSTLLWTSGMIKETILVFSLGLLLYSLYNYSKKEKSSFRQIFAILFFGFCLLNIKSYILFAILPGILSWIICSKIAKLKWLTTLSIHTIYLIFLFLLAPAITTKPVPELLNSKQQEFYAIARREHAKSVIELKALDQNYATLVKNIPFAFSVTFFRPWLNESKNPLMILAALENIFLLIFVVICLLGLNKKSISQLPSIFYLSIYFSLIMFILIGMVTPIIGAIVRYKVPALPFMMFAMACLSNAKWLKWNPAFLKLKKEQ